MRRVAVRSPRIPASSPAGVAHGCKTAGPATLGDPGPLTRTCAPDSHLELRLAAIWRGPGNAAHRPPTGEGARKERQQAWERLRQLNPGLPTLGGPGEPPKVIENPQVPKDLPALLGGRARVFQNPHFPSQ